mmetsp:Transcript_6988/g.11258  ORF Transcript_6988/g.11258 Transcript_6988/m.11258 type:complete len:266 (-) Transcript_6988:212-1009(-)
MGTALGRDTGEVVGAFDAMTPEEFELALDIAFQSRAAPNASAKLLTLWRDICEERSLVSGFVSASLSLSPIEASFSTTAANPDESPSPIHCRMRSIAAETHSACNVRDSHWLSSRAPCSSSRLESASIAAPKSSVLLIMSCSTLSSRSDISFTGNSCAKLAGTSLSSRFSLRCRFTSAEFATPVGSRAPSIVSSFLFRQSIADSRSLLSWATSATTCFNRLSNRSRLSCVEACNFSTLCLTLREASHTPAVSSATAASDTNLSYK